MSETNRTVFRDDALKNRNAFVTGGGTGICRAIAHMLARHGANVAVSSRKQENLDASVDEIKKLGVKGLGIVSDVRQPDQVEAAIAQTVEAFGGLDIVVNGAAGNFLAPVAQLSYNGFKTVIEIDLLGTYNVSKAALPHLQKHPHASIINISATLHYGGTPMQSHVSAAKAGIDALTRNLAMEWGPLGIRTNAIAPGPIGDTEGMRRLSLPDTADKMKALIPLKRFGGVNEIGEAAVFLASAAAAFINGAILVVDGGRCLNQGYFDL